VKHSRLAAFALLLVATAWGATFALVKDVLSRIDPEPFIFYRFTLAGIVLLAIAAWRRVLTRKMLMPGIALGLLVFSGYWLQTEGLILISPARSAFLTGLYVVIVPFSDRVIFGSRVTRHAWIASLLAVAGTGLMIGGFDARPTAGDAMTLLCAAIFAVHVVLTSRYATAHSSIGLAAIQVLFVGLAAGPFALAATRPAFSTGVVLVIVFTAIVTTALAFAVLMWGQARVTATEAAVILSFEPVAASLVSIFWEGEPMTAAFLSGALLILGAMVISQLPDRHTSQASSHSSSRDV
jgi:drug/metabolite transporter (DMT)-like permease